MNSFARLNAADARARDHVLVPFGDFHERTCRELRGWWRHANRLSHCRCHRGAHRQRLLGSCAAREQQHSSAHHGIPASRGVLAYDAGGCGAGEDPAVGHDEHRAVFAAPHDGRRCARIDQPSPCVNGIHGGGREHCARLEQVGRNAIHRPTQLAKLAFRQRRVCSRERLHRHEARARRPQRANELQRGPIGVDSDMCCARLKQPRRQLGGLWPQHGVHVRPLGRAPHLRAPSVCLCKLPCPRRWLTGHDAHAGQVDANT
mmetsp:Transcript_8400/g.34098  ORF Transcript_8400/g.34098 Transcript_8400/m.34098 type:complete len:260 (+) Transcript_8400:33-812(+)